MHTEPLEREVPQTETSSLVDWRNSLKPAGMLFFAMDTFNGFF